MFSRSNTAALVALTCLSACATAPRPEDARKSTSPDSNNTALRTALPNASPDQDYSPEGMFSQEHGDFLARSRRYRPSWRASFRGLPDASISGASGGFDLQEYQFDGMESFIVDPDTHLLVGAEVGARRYETSSNFGGVQDETVWGVGLNLGIGHFFGPDTYVEAVFSPGIYSDFDATLTHSDVQIFGHALATFEYHDSLFFKGGVEVSEVFDDFAAYPVLGLTSLFQENWRLDVLLPRYAEVSYSPNAASTLSLGLELDGDEYFVRSNAATGQRRSEMQIQELELYFGGQHRFDDHLSVFGRVGAVIAGDHKFQNPAGGRIDGQMDPSLMFEVGLGWDF